MRVNLVQIGNSQGIRLPKAVIEQAQLTEELDLEVEKGAIIIRSLRRPRADWEQDAIACHANGEDNVDDWDVTVHE